MSHLALLLLWYRVSLGGTRPWTATLWAASRNSELLLGAAIFPLFQIRTESVCKGNAFTRSSETFGCLEPEAVKQRKKNWLGHEELLTHSSAPFCLSQDLLVIFALWIPLLIGQFTEFPVSCDLCVVPGSLSVTAETCKELVLSVQPWLSCNCLKNRLALNSLVLGLKEGHYHHHHHHCPAYFY